MKATGIVRRIDDLGRVVIPRDIRHTLHIREGDPLELFIVDNGVCFYPYGKSLTQKLKDIEKEFDEVAGSKNKNRVQELIEELSDIAERG